MFLRMTVLCCPRARAETRRLYAACKWLAAAGRLLASGQNAIAEGRVVIEALSTANKDDCTSAGDSEITFGRSMLFTLAWASFFSELIGWLCSVAQMFASHSCRSPD